MMPQDVDARHEVRLPGHALHQHLHDLLRQRLPIILAEDVSPTQMSRLLQRGLYLRTQRRWKCYELHPKPQFSLKTGTIFEDSPLPLDKWLVALWLIVNCKNGISSMEISRDLGITQKSAWFMAHRLRAALHAGSFGKLSGEVEVDETFIGGKARNMHVAQRMQQLSPYHVRPCAPI